MGMAVLRSKYIPWKHLERFNEIAGIEVPRYGSNSSRPGLLARSYIGDANSGEIGVVQAYATPGDRGFYVGLSYPKGIEERLPHVKGLARGIRRAVKATTGRRIKTWHFELPDIEPKGKRISKKRSKSLELTGTFATTYAALQLTS